MILKGTVTLSDKKTREEGFRFEAWRHESVLGSIATPRIDSSSPSTRRLPSSHRSLDLSPSPFPRRLQVACIAAARRLSLLFLSLLRPSWLRAPAAPDLLHFNIAAPPAATSPAPSTGSSRLPFPDPSRPSQTCFSQSVTRHPFELNHFSLFASKGNSKPGRVSTPSSAQLRISAARHPAGLWLPSRAV